MKLHTGISKQYKRTFLLDEDGLRRIHSVLEEDVNKHGSGYVKYTVKREDDRFYDTDSVDEVLQDPNVFKQRITELTAYLIDENQEDSSHEKPDWLCRLIYKKDIDIFNSSISLNVQSTNRQRALILSDKLEPQILRGTKRIIDRSILIWPGLIFFLLLAFSIPLGRFAGIRITDVWVFLSLPVVLTFLFFLRVFQFLKINLDGFSRKVRFFGVTNQLHIR